MTQADMILRHLQDYGIMRLASRVNDLRREGHPIITDVVTGKNR